MVMSQKYYVAPKNRKSIVKKSPINQQLGASLRGSFRRSTRRVKLLSYKRFVTAALVRGRIVRRPFRTVRLFSYKNFSVYTRSGKMRVRQLMRRIMRFKNGVYWLRSYLNWENQAPSARVSRLYKRVVARGRRRLRAILKLPSRLRGKNTLKSSLKWRRLLHSRYNPRRRPRIKGVLTRIWSKTKVRSYFGFKRGLGSLIIRDTRCFNKRFFRKRRWKGRRPAMPRGNQKWFISRLPRFKSMRVVAKLISNRPLISDVSNRIYRSFSTVTAVHTTNTYNTKPWYKKPYKRKRWYTRRFRQSFLKAKLNALIPRAKLSRLFKNHKFEKIILSELNSNILRRTRKSAIRKIQPIYYGKQNRTTIVSLWNSVYMGSWQQTLLPTWRNSSYSDDIAFKILDSQDARRSVLHLYLSLRVSRRGEAERHRIWESSMFSYFKQAADCWRFEVIRPRLKRRGRLVIKPFNVDKLLLRSRAQLKPLIIKRYSRLFTMLRFRRSKKVKHFGMQPKSIEAKKCWPSLAAFRVILPSLEAEIPAYLNIERAGLYRALWQINLLRLGREREVAKQYFIRRRVIGCSPLLTSLRYLYPRKAKTYLRFIVKRRVGWYYNKHQIRGKWYKKRLKRWLGRFRRIKKNKAFSLLLRGHLSLLTGYNERELMTVWRGYRRASRNWGSVSLVQRFSQTLLLTPQYLVVLLGYASSIAMGQMLCKSGGLIINGKSSSGLGIGSYAMPGDILQISWVVHRHMWKLYNYHSRVKRAQWPFLQADWGMQMFMVVRWPFLHELIAPSFLSERWVRYYIRYFPYKLKHYSAAKSEWRDY